MHSACARLTVAVPTSNLSDALPRPLDEFVLIAQLVASPATCKVRTSYCSTFELHNVEFDCTQLHSPAMPRGRPKIKTATVTLRVDPEIKAAAEMAAAQDHRSLTNLVEVLLVNHCRSLNLYPLTPPVKE